MESTGTPGPAGPLAKASDETALWMVRQSNELRNPRWLRRGNTSAGEPKAPNWTLEEQDLLQDGRQGILSVCLSIVAEVGQKGRK